MAIVPERRDEGQYVSGSAFTGYFPETVPTGLVPTERPRIGEAFWGQREEHEEYQRLQKEAQRLRAENEARIEQLQANDWLMPEEKLQFDKGEITAYRAYDIGRQRKAMFMQAKTTREEKKRPKTQREGFIKSLIDTKFEGIDPRFVNRQKNKKELYQLKLAEYTKAYETSYDKKPTGSTLFNMMVTARKEADTEIDDKADTKITTLDNVIKHYDERQKAKLLATQKAQQEVIKEKWTRGRDILKEMMIRGRGEEGPSTPTEMLDFELTIYGKEVPEKRGTPEYQKARLKWIERQKEISPYTQAIERQIDVQTKKQATSLRKEFNTLPEVKTYVDIKQKYEVMGEALKESKITKNFVAVDQAIITLFNKMTDPESVVRESEYARTAHDLALWHRIKGKVKKWQAGGAGLTQNDREALYRMGKKFMQVAEKKYKNRLNEYKSYFTTYGLDPNKYLTPYGKKGIAGRLKYNPQTGRLE